MDSIEVFIEYGKNPVNDKNLNRLSKYMIDKYILRK